MKLWLSFLSTVVASSCFTRPIQVLYPDPTHTRLFVNDTGLTELTLCLRDSISLVGVVGPYHSGKSFLLNQLSGNGQVFKVGSSVDPETMGIWMLPTNQSSSADGSQIVLIDTEGFFGTDVAETYDANIFAITSLISSHLIYNSVKLIDQSSVDYLELLAQRTRLFSLRSLLVEPEKGLALASEFPPLTWVVEDFVQDLGKRTASNWLKEFIESKRDSNQPEGLASVFRSLDCETLFLPATSLSALRDLSTVAESVLTGEFREDMARLKGKLFSQVRVKQMLNSSLGPAQLSSVLRFLTESSNRRKFPDLPNYWGSWMRNLTENAKSDAAIRYRHLMEANIRRVDPPLTDEQVLLVGDRLANEVREYFRHLVFDMREFYEDKSTQNLLNASLMGVALEYGEANRERIRNLIRLTESQLMTKFEDSLSEIAEKDPQPMGQLNTSCWVAQGVAIATLHDFAGRYGQSQLFKDAERQLRETVAQRCSSARESNRRKTNLTLASVCKSTLASYKSALDESVRNYRGTPLTNSQILELGDRLSALIRSEFPRHLNESSVHWMDDKSPDYAQAMDSMGVVAGREFSVLVSRNEEAVWSSLQQSGQTMLLSLREELLKHLPLSQKSIRARLSERKTAIQTALRESLAAWGATPNREARLQDWSERALSSLVQDVIDQNTKQHERLFGESTRQCRRRELKKRSEECSLCKWLMPWRNLAEFNSINSFCLDEVQRVENLQISSEVKDEMLKIWESEMDTAPVVVFGVTTVASLVAVAFALMKR